MLCLVQCLDIVDYVVVVSKMIVSVPDHYHFMFTSLLIQGLFYILNLRAYSIN